MILPKRFDSKRRGDGGIDSARQPKHDMLESVLSGVITNSENQCPPNLFSLIRWTSWCGIRIKTCTSLDIGNEQPVLERGRLKQRLPVFADDEAPAVEDEIVLPSDAIDVNKTDVVVGNSALGNRSADGRLACIIGRSREVDDPSCPTCRLFVGRSVIGPEILAHVHAERPGVPIEHEHIGFRAGNEVALLGEDIERRQLHLVVFGNDLTVPHNQRAVI